MSSLDDKALGTMYCTICNVEKIGKLIHASDTHHQRLVRHVGNTGTGHTRARHPPSSTCDPREVLHKCGKQVICQYDGMDLLVRTTANLAVFSCTRYG